MTGDFKFYMNRLNTKCHNTKYFTKKFFEQFLKDNETAYQVLIDGGDVQEFWKHSETARSRFYTQNGGAYCVFLEIVASGV